MSKEMTLPSGATVVLRDVKTLKHGDRKRIYAAINSDGKTGLMEGNALVDALITVLVESWSFDLIPPSVRPESLDELDIPDYDALQAEGELILPILFPKLGKTIDGELDPKAITEDSNV